MISDDFRQVPLQDVGQIANHVEHHVPLGPRIKVFLAVCRLKNSRISVEPLSVSRSESFNVALDRY